jgi:hypothetical protein
MSAPMFGQTISGAQNLREKTGLLVQHQKSAYVLFLHDGLLFSAIQHARVAVWPGEIVVETMFFMRAEVQGQGIECPGRGDARYGAPLGSP